MKKFLQLIISVVLSLTAIDSKAQLPDGSIAPDWTLTDILGVSHHLYADLDAGKTVFIDVSATWCGPCWTYHNTGALEALWVAHGPIGGTNVSVSTTNDVMVYFIEGDGTTNTADLNGTGTSTQGDWVTGTSHPIIDPATTAINAFNSSYNIGYFPTIYMICPNRVIKLVGQASASSLYTSKGTCPAPATVAVDAALLSIPGVSQITCDLATLKTRLQNNSTTTMTSCTVIAKKAGVTVGTYNWSGSLLPYGTTDITFTPAVPITTTTTFTYSITTADAISTNNTNTSLVTYSSLTANSVAVKVKITTDRYGSETTWKMRNSAGTVVGSGGPYTTTTTSGSFTQTDVNLSLTLGCYTFELYDSYGDGFDGSYGTGSATVQAGGVTVFSTSSFTTDLYANGFKILTTVVDEEQMITDINVYPNPITNNANIDFNLFTENNISITLFNSLGQLVMVDNIGTVPSGKQSYSFDVSKYDNGFYFLNIIVGDNMVTKKISINK